MKIAIIHDFLTKIGGAEKVLLTISSMYPDAPIYTLLYDQKGTKGYFLDKKIISSNLNNYPGIIRKPKFLLSKFPAAIEQFDLSQYDVVISSSNAFAKGVLTKPQTLHLCYCHSPMRYAWDWYHEYLREHNFNFGVKGLLARSLLYKTRLWDRVSAERVDFWVANSKNVSERIKKYYHKSSEVIYPPVLVQNIKLEKNKEDYYIAVSRLEPYKNIELVVKAFNQNKKQLKIIGIGSQETYLKSIASGNISFLGWQNDEKVYELLGKAKGFIFPGEEDFGITPIEAMAAGTPVIALRKGGLLESVIENKTGIFFDKEESDSINEAIEIFEKHCFSADNCRVRAENFSEDNFKQKFQKTLEREWGKYHNQV